jgi:hypothetical protein
MFSAIRRKLTPSTVILSVVMASLSIGAGTAWAASTVTLCVPSGEGAAITTPTGGSCGSGTSVKLPSEAKEQEKLLSILPHISYEEKGIDEKPTIQFSGANVQIINGEGKTATTNGEGNLVIGYDENVQKHEQTGSHNLILGKEQTFTSFGGILGGELNSVTKPFASVTGGVENTASGEFASVGGGERNTASGESASVGGGEGNTASQRSASVSGGEFNTASGGDASVTGGDSNTASALWAAVSGGYDNNAEGKLSSIFGGKELKATKEYEAIP